MNRFGRKPPTDWKHVERFPLAAAPTSLAGPTPAILGINWYEAFDTPTKDVHGRWWIRESNLGSVLGGHAICVKCATLTDPLAWWDFYEQPDGSCVGFSESRAKSLVDRTRYGAHWLYEEAQKIDEWPGEDYEGTSVRAGLEVLRTKGHRRLINGVLQPLRLSDGISAYRWATSVEEVHSIIQMPLAISLGGVPLLQSWGRSYPHITWLPDSVLERLLNEDGEAATFTDR